MKDHPSHWLTSGLKCRNVTDRTSEHLDDRLPIVTKVRIGIHLASCPDCRAYVKQMALIRKTIALLPKQYPSPNHRLYLRQHFAARHAN